MILQLGNVFANELLGKDFYPWFKFIYTESLNTWLPLSVFNCEDNHKKRQQLKVPL